MTATIATAHIPGSRAISDPSGAPAAKPLPCLSEQPVRIDLAARVVCYLLETAGWDAQMARVRASLPHARPFYTGWDLVDSLIVLRVPFKHVDPDDPDAPEIRYPCLGVLPDGVFGIVLAAPEGGMIRAMYQGQGRACWQPMPDAGLDLISLSPARTSELEPLTKSAASLLSDLRGHIWSLLFASFIVNVIGLFTPLFVMTVYNRAIPAKSADVVTGLVIGLLLAFIIEMLIRRIRGATIVGLAAQLEHRLGLSLLRKLMAFPLGSLRRSSVHQQRARLRQFEGIRDAMVGPIVQVGLDLPFTLVFVGMLFVIAPPVAWIGVAAAIIQILFMIVITPFLRTGETESRLSRNAFRETVTASVTNLRGIRRLGGTERWAERLSERLDKALDAGIRAQFVLATAGHVSQMIVLIAGISGGFLATRMTMTGDLSVGGLVAVLVLIWRLLSPIQALSRAGGQVLAIVGNMREIDAVLSLPEELRRGAQPTAAARVTPPVRFDQVTLKFPEAIIPALSGVSLTLTPGTLTVLSGENMSGKTMLAELIAGLHPPTAGRLMIGSANISQIPVDDLRLAIAFCHQEPEFFFGTIRQNFELAQPNVTDAQIEAALAEAAILGVVRELPDGLGTRMNNNFMLNLAHDLKQCLSVARSFVREGPIFIFDQPTDGLAPEQATAIRAAIHKRRERGAVLLISNEPEDMDLADRNAVLSKGRLIVNDTGRAGREKARAVMKVDPPVTP